MTLAEAGLLLLIGSLLLPWVVYFSVKVGTFAFYRGREVFHETREVRDGNQPTKAREKKGRFRP